MTRLSTLVILSLPLFFSSCFTNCIEGTGPSVEEKRHLDNFNELNVDCSADVIIRENLVGEQNTVVVRAQENIVPNIITSVQGGQLKIDIKNNICNADEMVVEVYTNGLRQIEVNGSGDITAAGTLHAEDLKLLIDGSGNMDLTLEVGSLKAKIDGSGDMMLHGTATDLDLTIDGSGDVNAYDLLVNEAEIDSDGSGDAHVNVKNSIEVNLKGSGNVHYRGNPQEIKQDNNGSGNIRNEN